MIRYGRVLFPCFGKISIRIPAANVSLITLHVHNVQPNVPLISCLDVLDRLKIVADNVENELKHKIYGWNMPNISKNGQLLLVWNFPSVLFTKGNSISFISTFSPKHQQMFRTHKKSTSPSQQRNLSKTC